MLIAPLVSSWAVLYFAHGFQVFFEKKHYPIFKKIDFFTPASTVNKRKWGQNRSKIFLLLARAAKALQFDHQFHADSSIQSQEILKFVKNIKIATEIEAAIFPPYPFIFEMLSNLNK